MDYTESLHEFGFPEEAVAHVYDPKRHRSNVEIMIVPGFLTESPPDSEDLVWNAKRLVSWDYAASKLADVHQVRVLVIRWPSSSVAELLGNIGGIVAGLSTISLGAAARIGMSGVARGLFPPAIIFPLNPALKSAWDLKDQWDKAVVAADKTAEALGQFVASRSYDNICLVGHSLGGRISIKAMESCPDYLAPYISSVALAAAVLDEEVCWDNIRTLNYPRIDSMWSSGDLTLASLFRAGQLNWGAPIGLRRPRRRRRRLVRGIDVTTCGKRRGRRHGEYLSDIQELLAQSPCFASKVGKEPIFKSFRSRRQYRRATKSQA